MYLTQQQQKKESQSNYFRQLSFQNILSLLVGEILTSKAKQMMIFHAWYLLHLTWLLKITSLEYLANLPVTKEYQNSPW